MEKIYVVSVFFLKDKDYTDRIRVWGWFSDLETAEKCVLENWTDMYECGYYNRAVIEEMPEGVCVISRYHKWYKIEYLDKEEFDQVDSYKITEIEKPEIYKNVCNFAMG